VFNKSENFECSTVCCRWVQWHFSSWAKKDATRCMFTVATQVCERLWHSFWWVKKDATALVAFALEGERKPRPSLAFLFAHHKKCLPIFPGHEIFFVARCTKLGWALRGAQTLIVWAGWQGVGWVGGGAGARQGNVSSGLGGVGSDAPMSQ